MRRNALTFTFSIHSVLGVLVLLSAVGKAGEKQSVATASPLLASSLVVPADASMELLHDANPAVATVTPTASPGPRVMKMEVTAYCPCKKCCGKNARGITASGLRVNHNAGLFVAADTTLLPFHTRLLIPGYAGDAAVPVLDRGGAIKGNRIDVFFPTHKAALEWGRRMVEVTVIETTNEK